MNEIIQKAIDKLNEEYNQGKKWSRAADIVKKSVRDTLIVFCQQNAEFAQAVVQTDKTLAECIEGTVKGCGSGISDLEVYRRAVSFYFSGATVQFIMTIDLGDEGFSNRQTESEEASPKKLTLDLNKLLDF